MRPAARGPRRRAPRLPGGRRPYVRSALPARPRELAYDAGSETLTIGGGSGSGDGGTVSPVPVSAWEYEVQGVRVLESWFSARLAHRGPEAEGLDAVGPAEWPQGWTSELLALVTTLALLAELEPERAAFEVGAVLGADELRAGGVLPVPGWARRPASVLDHQEEGPGGQFALL